jgi:hypothetical protein
MTAGDANQSTPQPLIDIRADRRQFDDATFEAALAELRPYFRVRAALAVKLSDAPPLLLVLGFALTTLQAIPAELLSSALFDWLKHWARRPTGQEVSTIVFRVQDGELMVEASLPMTSDAVAHDALATLRDLARPDCLGKSCVFDPTDGTWKSPD